MGNIKDIFKILLVIQLIACTLATYGHPDAETIDFGTDPSRDQQIIEAAIRRGMDGEAVTELLRTKQPVVRVVTTPNGSTKTTTYKLEADGSISSKTTTQRRNSYTYTSGSIPDSIPIDDLRNSPDGTVTRTFTDENGDKVTQTIGVSRPKPSTVLDTDDLTGDWFNKPFPRWNPEPPSTSVHRTISRTFTGPNGERRTVQSWSSDPDFSDPESIITTSQATPATNYHRTVTRTYIGPNGEKRVVQTTSSDPDDLDVSPPKTPKFPSTSSDNWPGFSNFPSLSQPWGSTDTDSDDEWTVVEGNPDVETTTKKRFESWTPKTWNWPQFTTTTTAKPKIYIEPELPSIKPLTNLDDFLKSQYGPTSVNTRTTTTSKTPTNIPKYPITSSATQKPIRINIEDLPVTEILHNGKPANDEILKNIPPHLRPKIEHVINKDTVFKTENKHPVEEDFNVDLFSPKVETNIRKFSKTHSGPEKPSIQDLDPQMQDILRNAGISPEDITNIDGDTITKTRTEPDGRTITTTYKVKTLPSSVVHTTYKESTPVVHSTYKESTPVVHTNYHELTPHGNTHTYSPYKPLDLPRIPALTPFNPLSPKLSPISEFLAKLGLTKNDISLKNGQLTKTFTDDNGQILTATFVLSSPVSKRSITDLKDKPLK